MKTSKYVVLIALLFIACSDGGESSSSSSLPAPDYDFSGIWDGTLTGASTASIFVLDATQNGNFINGVLVNDAGFEFDITGSAWSDNIKLNGVYVLDNSYTIVCNGTCDGYYASGTWSDSAGQSGTWEALKQ